MSLLLALGLLAANAFFVCAEFALVSARRSRIDRLAAAGNQRARRTAAAMSELSLTLAGTQLGITAASLGLGAVAESALEHAFDELFAFAGLAETASDVAAFTLALLIVVSAHMVLGEMVPKNLAVSTPERAALLLGPPMFWIIQITKPFIWVLNALANACVRALRIEPVSEVANHHSPEDLAAMARQSFERGLLDPTERALAEATLTLHQTAARRVMTPWDGAVTVPPGVTATELERQVMKTRHTRFPVADDRVDRYIHANLLLTVDGSHYERPLPLTGYHALPSVTAETSLADVLTLMQEGRVELAAVREDSHVVGIVSLADVLRVLIPE